MRNLLNTAIVAFEVLKREMSVLEGARGPCCIGASWEHVRSLAVRSPRSGSPKG
jgi:hypothetical protein